MEENKKTPNDKQESTEAKIPALRELWERLPKGIRVLMVAVTVLSVAAGAALLTLDRTDHRVLFSSLEQDDAAAIVEHLKSNDISYKLANEGRNILVPSELVHELRIELAGEGLPVGSNVGFELFDDQRFGMTEFEEQMALRRALEGELARTIGRIESVKSARVHLVLPKKSFISSQSTKAQGSVVLELKGGRALSEETTNAILHLVSSSVEDLGAEEITILDTRGRLLSHEKGPGNKTGGLEYKGKYEANLELRLRQMLDQIMGPSSSVVRVAAHFDFTEQEQTEELYDPERAVVRSEQRETETIGGSNDGARGIPGTRTNLPGGATPENTGGSTKTKREKETLNYEIDKVIKRTVTPAGRLSKLSVAVLLDGIEDGEGKFKPRSTEQLSKIESAVKGAIGFDQKRGDRVEVQSIPFHIPEQVEMPEVDYGPPWWKQWLPVGVGAAVALMLIIALIAVLRKPKSETVQIDALPLPRKVHELETIIRQPDAALPAQVTERTPEVPQLAAHINEVQQVFMNESENASKVIRSWLSEG